MIQSGPAAKPLKTQDPARQDKTANHTELLAVAAPPVWDSGSWEDREGPWVRLRRTGWDHCRWRQFDGAVVVVVVTGVKWVVSGFKVGGRSFCCSAAPPVPVLVPRTVG
jgi:allantoicase